MSSDVGRYRRAYPRLFRHPGFLALTVTGQRLSFYLLFGPQTNRIGLFHFSIATAAEDLNVGVDTLKKALSEVRSSFGWHFDPGAKVFYIPSWWRWNHPDHEKVLQGNLKDLSEIPASNLIDAFAKNLAYLNPKLHESFVEALRIRMPKASSSQYQDQYQEQKQDQSSTALRAEAVTEEIKANGQFTESVLKTARETLKFADQNADMELLIDTFKSVDQHRQKLDPPRKQIIAALNAAILERRQREIHA